MRTYKKVQYELLCPICREQFEAKNIRAIYCGSTCRKRAERQRIWEEKVLFVKQNFLKRTIQNG